MTYREAVFTNFQQLWGVPCVGRGYKKIACIAKKKLRKVKKWLQKGFTEIKKILFVRYVVNRYKEMAILTIVQHVSTVSMWILTLGIEPLDVTD